jgi:hypothetical protein
LQDSNEPTIRRLRGSVLLQFDIRIICPVAKVEWRTIIRFIRRERSAQIAITSNIKSDQPGQAARFDIDFDHPAPQPLTKFCFPISSMKRKANCRTASHHRANIY